MNLNIAYHCGKICNKSILSQYNIQARCYKRLLFTTNKINGTNIAIVNTKCKYSTQISNVDEKPVQQEYSLIKKILHKLPFINVNKAYLNVAGYMLYESIADKINYVEFFEEFNLPDTFYSWFVITELHVWLLMVRCMVEGEDGQYVRNRIVQALWADVGLRVKKLGAANPAGARRQVHELSEQFQAAIIAYDEGLQSDDMVLAGAIWRRMYQLEEVEPEDLEFLVKYIRKHIKVLDSLTREELFSQKPISWESIVDK